MKYDRRYSKWKVILDWDEEKRNFKEEHRALLEIKKLIRKEFEMFQISLIERAKHKRQRNKLIGWGGWNGNWGGSEVRRYAIIYDTVTQTKNEIMLYNQPLKWCEGIVFFSSIYLIGGGNDNGYCSTTYLIDQEK